MRAVLGHLRKLIGRPPEGPADEAALLERFVHQHDEAAFAELARRHGPMVLGVCRRILQNADDADDAFQVTFLALACKARSVRDGRALASWLYRVASHTALRARANATRRRRQERQAPAPPCPDPTTEAGWRELGPVLDEELSRLPEKYRAPLVLCCFEGKTNEEAARSLGWPAGSLSKRLARGRELLRRRLARRGFIPAAGLLATIVSEATAAVPGPLAQATVRAALLIGAGRTAAGAVPASVAALLRQTLQAMLLKRLKWALMVFLVLGLLGMATALGLRQAGRPAVDARDERRARAGRPREDRPPGELARTGMVRLRQRGGVAALAISGDGKIVVSVGWAGLPPLAAQTDPTVRVWDPAAGKELHQFRLHGLAGSPLGDWAVSQDGRTLAVAPGEAFVMRGLNLGGGPGGFQFAGQGQMAPLQAARQGGNGHGKAANPTIRLWDVAAGRPTHQLPQPANGTGVPARFAFSRDSKLLASWGGDATVRLWNVATGQERARLALPPNQTVNCLAWSADGKSLAASCDTTIRLWHMPAGRPGPVLRGHQEAPISLAFSADGQILASAGATRIRLWDVARGAERRALAENAAPAEVLAFASDGRTVTAASRSGEVAVWDMATGREVRRLAFQQHPDHRDLQYGLNLALASCRYQPLALAADGRTVARFSAPVTSTPDGMPLTSGSPDTTIEVRDLTAVGKHGGRGP
jgi:RNA polymerase sigma factor (sigma-70 family)